jgi:hypothetical protein
MKELVILSFIIFVSIGYRVGYRVGVSSVSTEPLKPAGLEATTEANIEIFQNVKKIEDWFFPCNVIHIEIIERDEKDEKLYNELNCTINKFIDRKQHKSTILKNCYGASVNKNYCN